MQYLYALTAGGALIALAGCGGGGGSTQLTSLPHATGNPPNGSAPAGTAAVSISLTIPARSTAAHRHAPLHISAATASVVINVTGPSKTTARAAINAPSCSAGTNGSLCTIIIQAPIGLDTFTVTTYDGLNGTGNVLDTGTLPETVVAFITNTFPIVLGGTPAAFTFAFTQISPPPPPPAVTPAPGASPRGSINLPVIDGGIAQGILTVKDAAANTITGTYSSAVTISAPAGLLLGSTPTAIAQSTLSIAGSESVTFYVAYDGKATTALSLTSAAGKVSATAAIIPTTHQHVYSQASILKAPNPFRIIRGPDGALYWDELGALTPLGAGFVTATQPGAIARVDLPAGTLTEVPIAGIGPLGLHFVGNDLYIAETNTGTVGKIAGAASGGFSAANYTQLRLPHAPPPGTLSIGTSYDAPRELVDLGGKLYVTCYGANELAVIPLAGWPNAPVAIVPTPGQPPTGDAPDGITIGADGNLYLEDRSGALSQYTPGATSMTNFTGGSAFNAGAGRFDVTGTDGNIYLSQAADTQFPLTVQSFSPSTHLFTTAFPLATPLYSAPDSIHAGNGSTIIASDLCLAGIDVYTPGSRATYALPTTAAQDSGTALGINDVVDEDAQSYFFTPGLTLQTSSLLAIGHIVLAQGWQLLPEASTQQIDGLGPNGAIPIAVAASTANADTVTLAASPSSVCTIAAVPHWANLYAVIGMSAGSCLVVASDETGRHVVRTVSVTSNPISITARRRMLR